MADLFLIKIVKPKRVQMDAVRLELLSELHKQGRLIVAEYKKCVATWSPPLPFDHIISLAGGNLSLLVSPNGSVERNLVFKWLDEGTKRGYPVPRSGSANLVFQSIYTPKSSPAYIGSRAGGKSGNWVRRRHTWHPGIEPRRFTETIKTKYESRFKDALQEALKRGADKVFN